MSENNIPRHIAIIPDGNRRWAKAHKLQAFLGHETGAHNFEAIMREAFKAGTQYLTFWAASEDNLIKRPKEEIDFLIKLLTKELRRMTESAETVEQEIHVRVLGRGLAMVHNNELSEAAAIVEKRTAHFNKKYLTLLFGYDGRTDMIHAIEELRDTTYEIRPEGVAKALLTKELPDVDLLIRTGGEPHNSAGFLMWQTANSELYFTDVFWPDFDSKELHKALMAFGSRRRKLGA